MTIGELTDLLLQLGDHHEVVVRVNERQTLDIHGVDIVGDTFEIHGELIG